MNLRETKNEKSDDGSSEGKEDRSEPETCQIEIEIGRKGTVK